MTPETLTAFALAPIEQGGLGLDSAAAAVWADMWPVRICPAWKAMFARKIWRWQEQASRLELQTR